MGLYADTLSSGHQTNDPALVKVLCAGTAQLKDEFPFDRDAAGTYPAIQPLGSTVPRCVSIDHAIGVYAFARAQVACSGAIEVVRGTEVALERSADAFCARLESGDEITARAVSHPG